MQNFFLSSIFKTKKIVKEADSQSKRFVILKAHKGYMFKEMRINFIIVTNAEYAPK